MLALGLGMLQTCSARQESPTQDSGLRSGGAGARVPVVVHSIQYVRAKVGCTIHSSKLSFKVASFGRGQSILILCLFFYRCEPLLLFRSSGVRSIILHLDNNIYPYVSGYIETGVCAS